MSALRAAAGESGRYFVASGLALGIDFGVYSGLIRIAGVYYLVAAPIGFLLGLAAIYLLSVRWVFRHRRLASAGAEFALFALIGVAGLVLNQAIVYCGVQLAAMPYEAAKAVSAGVVFCFNFASRKLLLFTRA